MSKILLKLLAGLLALCAWSTSHAMACRGQDGSVNGYDTIVDTIAVPLDLPKNSILWRSGARSQRVVCWQDQIGPAEYVYFYLNPYNSMGANVELGITLDGRDYRCSELAQCRLPITDMRFAGCSQASGCPSSAITKVLNYSYFVSKKVGPMKPGTYPEGPIANVPDPMVAFQLDGVGGMNSKPNSNYRMHLSGMKNIRYVNCSVNMEIFPGVIQFGTAYIHKAEPGRLIEERTFTVQASKQCGSAAYGLDIVFSPAANSQVSASGDMLIPRDNTSVGINIVDSKSGQTLKFGTKTEYSTPTQSSVLVREYIARLRWNSVKPTAGEFNAAAIVDFYYK